jgi:hypothetical protein
MERLPQMKNQCIVRADGEEKPANGDSERADADWFDEANPRLAVARQ